MIVECWDWYDAIDDVVRDFDIDGALMFEAGVDAADDLGGGGLLVEEDRRASGSHPESNESERTRSVEAGLMVKVHSCALPGEC